MHSILISLFSWICYPVRRMGGEGNGTPLQYSCLETPWTEEPGRLQSMGLLRVGHDWATSLSLFSFMHWRRKWQPTPVFLPGESQGWGAWWAAVYGVAQSRTRLKRLSSSSSMAFYTFVIEKKVKIFIGPITTLIIPAAVCNQCHKLNRTNLKSPAFSKWW